jgi:hypothetical protein
VADYECSVPGWTPCLATPSTFGTYLGATYQQVSSNCYATGCFGVFNNANDSYKCLRDCTGAPCTGRTSWEWQCP